MVNQRLIAHVLRMAGAEVSVAANGQVAIGLRRAIRRAVLSFVARCSWGGCITAAASIASNAVFFPIFGIDYSCRSNMLIGIGLLAERMRPEQCR